MLSLIICSRAPKIAINLEKNIAETIGVGYELVIIDNSKKEYSIAEAYNLGLKRSLGNIQVFVHDDVLFQTDGWGAVISGIFEEDENVGLVGVAGNTIKTKMPSPWWGGPGKKLNNIVQHYDGSTEFRRLKYGFNGQSVVKVAAIDGVFMGMRKDARIYFDEELSGFHNYDMDLSMKHHFFKKNVVVTDKILLQHFSGGKMNKDWYNSTHLFHMRHRAKLPILAGVSIPAEKFKMHEFSTGANFVNGLLEMNMRKEALYWWFVLMQMKPFSKFHFETLQRFISN